MCGEKLFPNCKIQPSFSSKGLKKVDYVERQVQQMHDRVLGHLLGCAVALSGHFAGSHTLAEMGMLPVRLSFKKRTQRRMIQDPLQGNGYFSCSPA